MSNSATSLDRGRLVAVDVGNQRAKFGLFGPRGHEPLPEPIASTALAGPHFELQNLERWLPPSGLVEWWIGSVNRPAATRLVDWLRETRPREKVTLLAAGDLPLEVALPRPDMVGIDRLLDALAANRLRHEGRPAVVVDLGSAITVDLVGADGAFRGGAILPGIAMAAGALHAFTDLLPQIDAADLAEAPDPLGRDTVAAMRSGLFWGAVGAIRELAARLAAAAGPQRPDLFVTGGAGPAVAGLLAPARHVPHLTLAGIALAALG